MMTFTSLQPFAAALFGGALALAVVFRRKQSVAGGCFFAGMGLMAIESALSAMSMDAGSAETVAFWQTLVLLVNASLPGVWLTFSLTYSRGSYREFLGRWRYILAAAVVLPLGLVLGFYRDLLLVVAIPEPGHGWWVSLGLVARALNILLLIANVLILMNLEQTFRAAIGTMRWRIKFAVVGLAVIFGVRLYTQSQGLLFSGYNLGLMGLESGALLIGCTLIVIAYMRNGFAEIDVYPSQAVLQNSLTVLLVGGYLLVVGVFAQLLALLGGAGDFQAQAFLVLVGVAALAVLLMSERIRQRIGSFVSHHFQRPQHDFRKVWTLLTHRISSVMEPGALCLTSVQLISETFQVLSVTIWLVDEQKERLAFGSSTFLPREAAELSADGLEPSRVRAGLAGHPGPFDLEAVREDWGEALRRMSSAQFRTGGHRICVPLWAGERWLGLAVLADRVDGIPYTAEELDLLKCIGDQVAAGLLNLRLTQELMLAKELEAFQTMSTFFVHDLKNAASSLNLMLQNLPVHFDDPAFRADALRGIGSTVGRINDLIARLSILRNKLELNLVETDLNKIIETALAGLLGVEQVEVVRALAPLPRVVADGEQLGSVVTNLLFNARDAVVRGGKIRVETAEDAGWVVLTVADDGCGMSPAFLRDSLFRPFHTTKKKGLGIGMFQSKIIVTAHRGNIRVESEPGKGTTFRVSLPLKPQT